MTDPAQMQPIFPSMPPERVEQLCARFLEAWQAGRPLRLEELLAEHPENERAGLLRALVPLELALRRSKGEQPTLTEYEERFADASAWFADLWAPGATLTATPAAEPDGLTWTGTAAGHAHDDEPAPLGAVPGYDILGEVGRGGMGVVYRAHDQRRGQTVALKVMRHRTSSALYRFKHEFRSLADIVHPNLVQLYELVAHGRQWFFTMEFIEGVHFLPYLRPGLPAQLPEETRELSDEPDLAGTSAAGASLGLREAELRPALKQLAEGLSALHAAGTLHRDLKPSNVLVNHQGRVVIVDFGLAMELGHGEQHEGGSSKVLGTVAYMAPEQAAGQALSPAADWYSVGVMLYEVLTGRLPFRGTAVQVLRDKQRRDPPVPQEFVPEVPADLAALCMALLRRDPAERPTGQEVLRHLGEVGPTSAAAAHGSLLIGRETHLATLSEALAATRPGHPVVVGVHGRSGAGKTALVQQFLDQLSEEAAVVLTGRCYEQESVPYKALDSLIDALSSYLRQVPAAEIQALLPADVVSLTRIFPVLRRVEAVAAAPRRAELLDPQDIRRRAFTALRELLARLAERRPLVLAIDDLQWGDMDSASLLTDVLRPPGAPGLLLIMAYRREEAASSPFLRTFLPVLTRAGAELPQVQVPVDALSPEEARTLCEALMTAEDAGAPTRAAEIARESGGSPFFVHELVQHLRGGGATPGGVSLDEVLWTRVQRLPEEARQLLETVAVAGGPVEQDLAFQVAGLGSDLRGVLGMLRVGRLIRSTGPADRPQLETYHDRVRETVATRLPLAGRQQRHRALARALEASQRADAEIIAMHFQAAGEPHVAGQYFAQAAAKAAQALAFDRAAELYRRALELQAVSGEEERRLRVLYATALANAGRGPDAAHAYLAAAAGAVPDEALDRQRRAAMHFLISGRVDEGMQVVRTVLSAVGLRWPASSRRVIVSLVLHRAWLKIRGLGFRERPEQDVPSDLLRRIDVSWSVVVGLSRIHTIRGAELQARHLLLALRGGEPYRVARALCLEAGHSATIGSSASPRTVHLLDAARAIQARVLHPHTLGLVTLIQGMAEYLVGRWRKGLELCEQATTILEEQCTGVMWELNTARAYCLYALYFLGETGELTRRLGPILKDAEERGNLFVLANHATFTRPLAQLAADEPETALKDLDRVMARWSQQGFQAQHFYSTYAHVQIHLYRGDAAAAHAWLAQQWRGLAGSLLLRVQHVRIFSYEARARATLALAAQNRSSLGLQRQADRDIRRLEREPVGYAQALARWLRAGLAAVRGERESVIQLGREALAQFEAVEMRLHAATVRDRLAELIGGTEGEALRAQSAAWMAGQSIRNPARMVRMLSPSMMGIATDKHR